MRIKMLDFYHGKLVPGHSLNKDEQHDTGDYLTVEAANELIARGKAYEVKPAQKAAEAAQQVTAQVKTKSDRDLGISLGGLQYPPGAKPIKKGK